MFSAVSSTKRVSFPSEGQLKVADSCFALSIVYPIIQTCRAEDHSGTLSIELHHVVDHCGQSVLHTSFSDLDTIEGDGFLRLVSVTRTLQVTGCCRLWLGYNCPPIDVNSLLDCQASSVKMR